MSQEGSRQDPNAVTLVKMNKVFINQKLKNMRNNPLRETWGKLTAKPARCY